VASLNVITIDLGPLEAGSAFCALTADEAAIRIPRVQRLLTRAKGCRLHNTGWYIGFNIMQPHACPLT
jgi:hypothetical protein